MYTTRFDRQHTRRNPTRFLKLIVFLLMAGTLIAWFRRSESIISPLPDVLSEKVTNTPTVQRKKDPQELRTLIESQVGSTWNNYSILVDDYTSDFEMDINSTIIYNAASVNKIPILASLYFLAQKGDVDLDRVVTLQAKDIQDYGTGSIRYDPPGTTYSVKTLAQLMIKKSDNTAAYLLANHVMTLKQIQGLVESWGLTQTDMITNKTSNRDIAILVVKIYSGQLVNQALTQEMMAFFLNTDFENRLPALLPKTAKVYHKIGTDARVVHDAGIVVDGNTSYYVGIFTDDIVNVEETDQLIAQVSNTIFTFMQ